MLFLHGPYFLCRRWLLGHYSSVPEVDQKLQPCAGIAHLQIFNADSSLGTTLVQSTRRYSLKNFSITSGALESGAAALDRSIRRQFDGSIAVPSKYYL